MNTFANLPEVTGKINKMGTPLTLLGKGIKIGDMAPDFTAVDASGKSVKLSDYKGKIVLLSIFPSIDTKVCAMQTRRFNKEAVGLSKNVAILTISKDLPFALGRFCAAEGISNVITLSDYMESEFGVKYGFLIKENKLLSRGVVIIAPSGQVSYVSYVPNIVDEPNYEEALQHLKVLSA